MAHHIHSDNASKSFVNYIFPDFLIEPILGTGIQPYLDMSISLAQ
jgi:hypothetical protein